MAGPAVGANNGVDFAETVRTGVQGCSRVSRFAAHARGLLDAARSTTDTDIR